MMKKILFAFAVLLITTVACTNNKPSTTVANNEENSTVSTEAKKDTISANEQESPYLQAIDSYLAKEIGSQYAPGEHCVPLYSIVSVDESHAEDILVWGDFWVFNYNQAGDTLKCVSGGSHPGLMHLHKTDKGYEVSGFDQVEDGSNNLPSAKRIFGDKYDAFHAINSNEEQREKLRADVLSAYVKKNNLSVTMYQDYGWPAKKLE